MRIVWLLLLLGLFGCSKKEVPYTFYYWKSVFKLNSTEQQDFKKITDPILYVRYFDIEWNNAIHQAIPVTPIQFETTVSDSIEIVPVVYIKNQVFEQLANSELMELASQTYSLVSQINKQVNKNSNHIQFDCDWTLSTKDNYFNFLKRYKEISHIHTQATIRLHQIKYYQKTGVPPVEQGILMYYNMNELNTKHKNSIYDHETAHLYLASLKKYPLPLHYALPIFSWAVVCDGDKVKGLLNKTNEYALVNDTHLLALNNNRYQVKSSYFRNGYYLKKGMFLKLESVSPSQIEEIKSDIEKYAPVCPQQFIYFDLDSLNTTLHDLD